MVLTNKRPGLFVNCAVGDWSPAKVLETPLIRVAAAGCMALNDFCARLTREPELSTELAITTVLPAFINKVAVAPIEATSALLVRLTKVPPGVELPISVLTSRLTYTPEEEIEEIRVRDNLFVSTPDEDTTPERFLAILLARNPLEETIPVRIIRPM
jgi:hypothetical protein